MKQNSLWYLHVELDHCSNKPVFFSEKMHIPSGNSDDVQQAQNSSMSVHSQINLLTLFRMDILGAAHG